MNGWGRIWTQICLPPAPYTLMNIWCDLLWDQSKDTHKKLYTMLGCSAVGNRKKEAGVGGGGTESMRKGQVITLTRVTSVGLPRRWDLSKTLKEVKGWAVQRSRPRRGRARAKLQHSSMPGGLMEQGLVWLESGHRREGPITRDCGKDTCQLLQGRWLLLRMRWEFAARFRAGWGHNLTHPTKMCLAAGMRPKHGRGQGKNGETRWKATSSDSGKRCQWLGQVVAVEIKRSISPYAREELRMTPSFLAQATKLTSV